MMQRPLTDPKVALFGLAIDALTMDAAVQRLCGWIIERHRPCRYVVTPNLDHLVQLRHDAAFQQAYRDASLVMADGWPLVLASRCSGRPLPERVAGSDLVPRCLPRQPTCSLR
jgi:N-acetylglucosaminyldiphosphoundecaprenol N-acetyl-beta-D-mannosaminyltransferase